MTVSIETARGIATVTIDNPPVNALSQPVRQGLDTALKRLEADSGIVAAILACSGRGFIAGADIREFGQPPAPPPLPELVRRLSNASKPWIAAIHGSALGGGLEIALACRYRIATPEARLGFPEVGIGAVPGAGGTVMLPRLVPALTALEMIATGRPLDAVAALEAGLIDEIAEGDPVAAARRMAHALLADTAARAPILARPVPPLTDAAGFDAAAARILKRAGGQAAPREAVRLLRHALTAPVEEALAEERRSFLRLRDDPQARALRHIFFAERAAGKLDRLRDCPPGPLGHIGVIGGGTMGAGIAAACLIAGMQVTMIERDDDDAAAAAQRVGQILDGARARGRLPTDAPVAFAARSDYAALGPADLVIEAVFEDMAVKHEVFARLDAVTRPEAVLASNTSYLDIAEIARATARPGRVLGLHFFAPAHIMKLLEIVTPKTVSDSALATGTALARKLGKIAVHAGVCDGFIANRLLSAYRLVCDAMLLEGALPWEIDAAMTGFGLPMGIYRMQDLAGLDIAWAMRKRRAAAGDPAARDAVIADRLCEMGRLGEKAGRGWYRHENGSAQPDPEVEALILAAAREKGIARRPFDAEEIMARILGAMQAEGARILAEGIARSADDIDVVMVNAFGFPRWRGGPMFMARTQPEG